MHPIVAEVLTESSLSFLPN